jgi:adenine C2-methylase RlmN of 23S rRNA A2503 and tRNA A37
VFHEYLASRGLNTSVRTTRGIDISAACGQLGKAKQQADSWDLAQATSTE